MLSRRLGSGLFAGQLSKMNDLPSGYHSLNKCLTLLIEFLNEQVTNVFVSNFDNQNRAQSVGSLIFF